MTVSDQAQAIIREAARRVAALPPEALKEIETATLTAPNMAAVVHDPELREAVRRATVSNLAHWVQSNIERPGEAVAPNPSPQLVENVRNLVRRGLDQAALDGYRGGQNAAWQRWMQIVFEITADPVVLQEVLISTAASIAHFVDAAIEVETERISTAREVLLKGSLAERRATVGLLLEGVDIQRKKAEAALQYPLTGTHTALVLWSEAAEPDTAALQAAADQVARHSSADRALPVAVSSGTLWLWLHAAVGEPAATPLDQPAIRMAVGRAATELEGFRRSHLEAVTTQRVLSRLGTARRSATFDQIRLTSLTTVDQARADEFVRDVLGSLATAPPDLRDALHAYLTEQSSVTRAAARLHSHRNTVQRRLERATALLPRDLATTALEVAVALDVDAWNRGAPSPGPASDSAR